MTTAAVEQYTGEGEPPYCEMTLRATDSKTTPPDLTVEANLKGVQKPAIIKFEKEAQNVVDFVCQVFYHKIAFNFWRARVALFPKKHLKVISFLKPSNGFLFYMFRKSIRSIKMLTTAHHLISSLEVA